MMWSIIQSSTSRNKVTDNCQDKPATTVSSQTTESHGHSVDKLINNAGLTTK